MFGLERALVSCFERSGTVDSITKPSAIAPYITIIQVTCYNSKRSSTAFAAPNLLLDYKELSAARELPFLHLVNSSTLHPEHLKAVHWLVRMVHL